MTVQWTKLDEALCINFDHPVKYRKETESLFFTTWSESRGFVSSDFPTWLFWTFERMSFIWNKTHTSSQNTNNIYIYFSTICCNHIMLLVKSNIAHLC